MINIRQFILKCHWIVSSQFGIDPLRAYHSLRGLPRYIRDAFRFIPAHKGRIEFKPCLFDWYEENGATKSEYFWQDLVVARMIFAANPDKHVDIGSRVDGFVAHVASYRKIEVLDIRPTPAKIPGVLFKQADLMKPAPDLVGYCDSLSCLHALEHFGLGRYGDEVNPQGFELGLSSMATVLRSGGTFYLSVPIGIERVEFNANRVFDPRVIVRSASQSGLTLSSLIIVKTGGEVEKSQVDDKSLLELSKQRYALGIFCFQKCPALKIDASAYI